MIDEKKRSPFEGAITNTLYFNFNYNLQHTLFLITTHILFKI